MLHASTRKLIDRLSEMTELGKLDWTESENGNIAYATEGYSVSLTENPNEVIITSKDGKELERATADEIAATEREDGASYTAIVAAMTSEAARIARGTEAAISSLLADMEDTPEVEAVDELSETVQDAPALHEDPGDETTALAADSIETVSQEETVDATETEAQSVEDQTSLVTTEVDTEIAEAEALSEPEEADTDSETDTFADADDKPVDAVTETPSEPEVAPVEIEASASDEALSSNDAAEDAADTDSSEPPATAYSQDEAVEDEQPEEIAAATEPETEMDAEPAPVADYASQDSTEEMDVETETDVTEAVKRMAGEVKQREDTGLETAAASAVGAVALAAGLTPQEPETEDTPEMVELIADADTMDGTVDQGSDTTVSDIAEPPAYVPFGLNEATQDETPELAPQTEWVASAEPSVDAETTSNIEPEIEDIAAPMEALGQLAEDTFASRAEVESVEETPFGLDDETAATEDAEMPSLEAETHSEPAFVAETEAATPDLSTIHSDDTSPPAEIAVSEPEPQPEPEPETMDSTTEPEAPAQESYSLSGIGAGFGLGALSAKTEASGLPGTSSTSVQTGEKVVIDATDDVLPKLEGNLNVSLAETASAAVSNANANIETSPSSDEAAESEADILKPRTRFNPWD